MGKGGPFPTLPRVRQEPQMTQPKHGSEDVPNLTGEEFFRFALLMVIIICIYSVLWPSKNHGLTHRPSFILKRHDVSMWRTLPGAPGQCFGSDTTAFVLCGLTQLFPPKCFFLCKTGIILPLRPQCLLPARKNMVELALMKQCKCLGQSLWLV